jgi:hypothetical protein
MNGAPGRLFSGLTSWEKRLGRSKEPDRSSATEAANAQRLRIRLFLCVIGRREDITGATGTGGAGQDCGIWLRKKARSSPSGSSTGL